MRRTTYVSPKLFHCTAELFGFQSLSAVLLQPKIELEIFSKIKSMAEAGLLERDVSMNTEIKGASAVRGWRSRRGLHPSASHQRKSTHRSLNYGQQMCMVSTNSWSDYLIPPQGEKIEDNSL